MPLEARLMPRPLSPHSRSIDAPDDGDVDSAPDDGRGALLRNASADMGVANRGRRGPKILSGFRNMHRLATRQVRSALLLMGAYPSFARRLRHFARDFGRGLDLPITNLMAHATLIGSIFLTVIVWTEGIWTRGALL
jgi:hypothetical protein